MSDKLMTNNQVGRETELGRRGQALIDAAADYWEQYQKECGCGSVVWLKASNGSMVVMTMGEYRDTLMRNIDDLWRDDIVTFKDNPFTEGGEA